MRCGAWSLSGACLLVDQVRGAPLHECGELLVPRRGDLCHRLSRQDALAHGVGAGQAVEVPDSELEGVAMQLTDRHERRDRGACGIIRRTIRDRIADPVYLRVGVFAITGVARRERHRLQLDTRQIERPQALDHALRIEPGRTDLLERRVRAAADRDVGALEQAGARVVCRALERRQSMTGTTCRRAPISCTTLMYRASSPTVRP